MILGELSEKEIEDLLSGQLVGRVGCYQDGIVYIVPLNYVYDGGIIYSHSFEGMKVRMMRKNPDVCFQIDNIKDLDNWQCVIAWGTFEEITDMSEKQQVMQKLINRFMPLMKGDTAQPSHGFTAFASDVGPKDLIIYKIRLKKKTGRFEKGE